MATSDMQDFMDDSLGDRKVKRFRLTHNQSRYLMSEFARQAHPDAAQRERLSREIPGLTPRQVQVWFQNRRAKLKRMSSDDRYRMMKSRALPDEFPILQTLHSYDLNFASRQQGHGPNMSYCSPERQRPTMPSPIEGQNGSNYALSSGSRLSCSTDCSSASCQISPTSPLSAQLGNERLPRTEERSFSFQDQSLRLQPLTTYFEPDTAYRTVSGGCMIPDSSNDARMTKSVGGYWQTKEVEPMHMYPNWRRSMDVAYQPGMNFNPSSPQSGSSSVTSDDYFAESLAKQQQQQQQQQQLSAPPDAQVFNLGYVASPPSYVPMQLQTESANATNHGDHRNPAESSTGFRKGHRSQRSLSQPPDFPHARSF